MYDNSAKLAAMRWYWVPARNAPSTGPLARPPDQHTNSLLHIHTHTHTAPHTFILAENIFSLIPNAIVRSACNNRAEGERPVETALFLSAARLLQSSLFLPPPCLHTRFNLIFTSALNDSGVLRLSAGWANFQSARNFQR
jgi:hypothetical protein